MSVSKRTRFEIFKRDGFRCVYCGTAPTSTVLHVDHVVPKSKGGSDDPTNLVTSCQSCNGGKSNVRLEDKRHSSSMNTDIAKDHADQILGYLEAQRLLVAARDELVVSLRVRWEELIDDGTTASERGVLRSFSEQFAFSDLVEAMEIAAAKFYTPYQRRTKAFKYFCGIVRRWRETGIVSKYPNRSES